MTEQLILMVSFRIDYITLSINMNSHSIDDRLEQLLKCFELKAHVFQAGPLNHPASFQSNRDLGYIHLLRKGKLLLKSKGASPRLLDEPCVFFYMNAINHQLLPQNNEVDLICASFEFGAALKNPLIKALPDMIILKQHKIPTLLKSLALLFDEASEFHCGRQAILDRQIEIIIIKLLRNLMDENRLQIGLLAGMADPRLAKAINAMHGAPARQWSLEDLSQIAGMSRASFARRFHNTVGSTPGNYLVEWRLGLAQSLLSRGKSVQYVADAVGYGSASAFSRVFTVRQGLSPSAWKKQYK